jgi:hypothetical protein
LKIKTITQSDPTFLKTAYAHDHLIDLMNHERFINDGEMFLQYERGAWKIYKMPKDQIPKLLGRYKTLHSAVYKVRNA